LVGEIPAGGGSTAVLDYKTEYLINRAATITELIYNTRLADGTSVLKILVNGVVQATVTLAGLSGVSTVSVPVVALDKVAVEYDAGQTPDEAQIQLFLE
jgi:hypothetical protein